MSHFEFTRDEYERRLETIQRLLRQADLPALLLLDEANYRYFTGHYTEAWKIPDIRRACWVLRDQTPILIVPPGERADARRCSPWPDVIEHGEPTSGPLTVGGAPVVGFAPTFARALSEAALGFGLEPGKAYGVAMGGWTRSDAPLGVFTAVKGALGGECVDVTALLWEARLVKSPAEIAYTRLAVGALDVAFAATFQAIEEGMTELEIARRMRGNVLYAGADHDAFTFVDSDVSRQRAMGSAPGDSRLRAGSLMAIDAGAIVHGYTSDYDRLALIGTPTRAQERAYETVVRAHRAGIDRARPGVTVGEVASTIWAILAETGGEPSSDFGVGHGLGVELPEPPWITVESPLMLREGMVLTIEPSVVVPGVGLVIVEDVIAVTANGAENLSTTPTPAELVRL